MTNAELRALYQTRCEQSASVLAAANVTLHQASPPGDPTEAIRLIHKAQIELCDAVRLSHEAIAAIDELRAQTRHERRLP